MDFDVVVSLFGPFRERVVEFEVFGVLGTDGFDSKSIASALFSSVEVNHEHSFLNNFLLKKKYAII